MLHLTMLALLVTSICMATAFKSWTSIRISPYNQSLKVRGIMMISQKSNDQILKRIDDWACVKQCGACCKLGPLDSRPDLETYLSKDELELYKSMIGPDDWCIHFDKVNRMCTQYEKRPGFCVVDPNKFKVMFKIVKDELTDFCKFCCREQIADAYGEESVEMDRFEDVIEELEDEVDL